MKYNYFVINISDDDVEGYKAVIPKFPNVLVMADTVNELHEQVEYTLNSVIKNLIKKGKRIPPEDKLSKFKGKVMIRIAPELHEKLYYEAQAHNASLNKYIEAKLKSS